MHNTVNKKYESGFTLLELAIVFVLIGLVLVPAISLYHNYRIDKDWTNTEEKMNEVINAIGGFRSVYAKYPCPASQTATPGSLNYGLEDCSINAPNTCVNGICTYNSNIAGQVVVVGALPFKIINIQESESYDSNLNRFRYAVTRDLTDSTTFSMSGGGIGIIDKTATMNSIIDPPNRGHFVVISHGSNKIGGFTKAGVESSNCASGTLLEQENCDADSVFLSGEIDNNFDDRIEFFSSITPSEWQTSEADSQIIHLKNLSNIDNFSVGTTVATNLTSSETATIRSNGMNDGTVVASNDFYSETLCEYGTTSSTEDDDCFAPRLIAGLLNTGPIRLEAETTGGSGMSCYKPSEGRDEYLVGIENGEPICAPEIFISCPNGDFITGIDTDGNVVCDTAPLPRCADENITTFCGDSRTLTETYSGDYGQAYSGECRMINDYDRSYFATALSGLGLNQINALVGNLNSEPRTIVDCGSSVNESQVRDTYLCNAGNWEFVSAHEKFHPWNIFPENPNSGGLWPAENSYSGPDINNNNGNHDCWCREDYRVRTYSCPNGQAGDMVAIQRHRCPQTSHRWQTVYTSGELCECTPGTTTTTQSCNSYYDEINNTNGTSGLSGSVTQTFEVTCSGNTSETAETPISVDTSSCHCPSYDQYIQRENCPRGTTNSWNWSGGTEVGIENLSTQDWICPVTTTGGLPDPGGWSELTPYSPIPACVCDSNQTGIVVESCPAGLEGAGMTYEREWDCTTNTWEPEENWVLLENNCNICTWQAPSGSPSILEFAYGEKKGSVCSCGSSPVPLCHDYGADGKYKVWTGCQCIVQK